MNECHQGKLKKTKENEHHKKKMDIFTIEISWLRKLELG
jgi:hypothetical protein